MEGQFSIEEHNTPKFSIKLTWVLAVIKRTNSLQIFLKYMFLLNFRDLLLLHALLGTIITYFSLSLFLSF